jgi:hypothetical protein
VAQIGLRQAARLTGRNQSTLHRAMKAGRLSYTVDAAGQRRIDTAELDRVFGVNMSTIVDNFSGANPTKLGLNGASGASACEALQSNTAHAGEHAALERLLADREASIADLRARLDASEAERRQLSERLHGMLTARTIEEVSREPTHPPSASSGLAIPRPPWWRRWFR